MSWLSNHHLNALLTSVSELRRLQTAFDCQDACCLTTLLRPLPQWGGVLAADELPSDFPPRNTTYYIVNSEPSTQKGQHWLALRLAPNAIEFFDSYGRPPSEYPLIYAWLKRQRQPIVYLTQCLQGTKPYCGAYCYYFVTHRPYADSLYATFFKDNGYMFRTRPPFNDDYVFHELHEKVKDLVSIFD